MSKISKLGEYFNINAQVLVDTRLLVQANSGGGKSYAVRKLLEVTHGQLQQIVLDIEGDFSSLRGKFDYILAGKGGEIPASVKTAKLLARKVLELGTDIIIDLYELKHPERIKFVRLFLEEMMDAPKSLWHPVLVVLDEAHLFAPEKGNAESLSAVIDLCTRGRKRGFGAVLATQRLSKLHKDAAAECNNKLIGRTNLDIDVKRAADELGFSSKDMTKFRALKAGEFFAFGPAISNEIVRGMIGKAETVHPTAGTRGVIVKPSLGSSKIKQALKELADLPKEADEELKTTEDLNLKIRTLTSELSAKPAPQIDQAKMDQRIESSIAFAKSEMQKEFNNKIKAIKDDLLAAINKHSVIDLAAPMRLRFATRIEPKEVPKKSVAINSDVLMGACERKILGFLASQSGKSFNKVQLGAMTGYAHSSGSFSNALSKLNQTGHVLRDSGMIRLNSEIDHSQYLEGVPHTLQDWISKLGACERAIYSFLLESPDELFTKTSIAENTNYSAGSGSFSNAISKLNTLGLIKREGGSIKINDELLGL